MKTIQIYKSFSTGLESSLDGAIDKIDIKEDLLGFGGFGEVFEVTSINSQPNKLPLVAKVLYTGKEHNYHNIIALQELVQKEIVALKDLQQKFFDNYPSLIALPLLSFEGVLARKTIKGYLSLDLNKLGFINAETFFRTNTDHWILLQNRPLFYKYKITYELAKGCSFLRKNHYIHADMTPDNLFIHPIAPLCALIDFDSGAIITSTINAPTTEGKHYSEWEAPELTCDDPKINKLTAFVDDWALAITIHKTLTGWPAFFTKHCTYTALEKWSKMYEEDPELLWPNINSKQVYADLFIKENLAYFDKYMECYAPIDDNIKKGFQVTFVKGATNYLKRWDSYKWVATLQKSIETCKSNSAKETINFFETREQSVREHFPDEQAKLKVCHFPNHKNSNTPQTDQNQSEPLEETDKKYPPSTKLFLDSYIEDLLPDLISGKVSLDMHKGFITKYAKENGFDGDYISDLQEFVKLFKESTKDKTIANFEYIRLILLAKLINVKKDLVDQLLKPYKQK